MPKKSLVSLFSYACTINSDILLTLPDSNPEIKFEPLFLLLYNSCGTDVDEIQVFDLTVSSFADDTLEDIQLDVSGKHRKNTWSHIF